MSLPTSHTLSTLSSGSEKMPHPVTEMVDMVDIVSLAARLAMVGDGVGAAVITGFATCR